MNVLIVYSHPNPKSFNHAILQAVEEGIAWLREIATQPSDDSRPSLELLREVRGEGGDGA